MAWQGARNWGYGAGANARGRGWVVRPAVPRRGPYGRAGGPGWLASWLGASEAASRELAIGTGAVVLLLVLVVRLMLLALSGLSTAPPLVLVPQRLCPCKLTTRCGCGCVPPGRSSRVALPAGAGTSHWPRILCAFGSSPNGTYMVLHYCTWPDTCTNIEIYVRKMLMLATNEFLNSSPRFLGEVPRRRKN